MAAASRNALSDLRGVARLATDGVTGITDLVETMHRTVAAGPASLGGPVVRAAVHGTTALVCAAVRGVTTAVGGGLDVALGALAPGLGEAASTPGRDAFLAALNGIVGDHLEAEGNPLALPMQLRRHGEPLRLEREALAAVPGAAGTVAVLIHGLCMPDATWRREAGDFGARLAEDLGVTSLYLFYNTGRHVAANGREFADLLERLLETWPVTVERLVLVGHSMGGLVARSAYHYGRLAGHRWPDALGTMVFLGTPHHGAPLERVGHWLDQHWHRSRYIAPFARLGRVRSAGITDLRHGTLTDEEWQGHDRFGPHPGPRVPLPLPAGVRCCTVAATLGPGERKLRARVVGDGLVPVPSALGRHAVRRLALGFPRGRRLIVPHTGHLELLESPVVYEHLRRWIAEQS